MSGQWVRPVVRDEVVEFVQYWQQRAGFKVGQLLKWIGLGSSKYYSWQQRQGQANQHNGHIPKAHWLLAWEKAAIESYARQHPELGYRCLSYMMLDENVVAVSPSRVQRVLQAAGLLQKWVTPPSRKGQGFVQPPQPHQHWHIDISYLNLSGTFYYLCAILDGYSRYLVQWDIRPHMTESEVELTLQRAREKFPDVQPRLISDNGPQFIAPDFKHFIRHCQMSHVRTSPYYPQSKGKIERWHTTLKSDAIRPKTPLTLEDARRVVQTFVNHYNKVRLHSAIGYVTPKDRLSGRDKIILAERKNKLWQARKQRHLDHQSQPISNIFLPISLVISQPENSISR
jgi:putative transposase